jgi:hypothetical protein
MTMVNVGDGALKWPHATTHVGVVYCHVPIQVVCGLPKMGNVAVDKYKIANDVIIFFIDVGLKLF